jgi:universal stress protein A
MRLRASPRAKQRVVVELESPEASLPPIAVPELKLKRILVPIDFSEQSQKALHYAISFAKQFNAEIFLLHVVETVPTPEVAIAESGVLNFRLRDEAKRELSDWRKEVPHAAVKTAIYAGIPFREIVRAADEHNTDLIILGTQGRTGLSHLFIGSTAERVVRHAPCPVMVVREREHDFLEEEKKASAKKRNTAKQTQARRPFRRGIGKK